MRKPYLPSEVHQLIENLRDEVRGLIFQDAKTPLLNFSAFEALWPELISSDSAHLLFVEVDGMKNLNTKHGHDNADLFLIELAEVLQAESSKDGEAFHMSGDEFLVVTARLSGRRVDTLARRIVRKVSERRIFIAGKQEQFTISIGIAPIDSREEVSKFARDRAELAVVEAKKQGGNSYAWFDEQMEFQPPRAEYRKDCSCGAHFSVNLRREVYDDLQKFHCPVCNVELPK